MNYPRKIYAIRHNATDRVYIGSSCNVDRRVHSHLLSLRAHRHPVPDMQKDFDEYGEDFTVTVLDRINGPDEKNKEYEWMDKYQSFVRGIGYNYKDLKRRAEGKAMAEDDETPTEVNELSENERELLDIIHNSANPTEALLYVVSLMYCYLHPEVAEAVTRTTF